MAAPDYELFSLFKEWVWAPTLAIAGWAWNRNVKEHDMLWKAHAKRIEEITATRKDAGDSHSVLMDRLVSHVDATVERAMKTVREEDRKIMDDQGVLRDHVTKLFENAEKDRASFREALENHARRSDDRHAELLKGQHEIMKLLYEGLATKADK